MKEKLPKYLSLFTVIFVAVGLLLLSCNKEKAPDCFQAGGEEKTLQRSLDDFDKIELRDYLNIELVDSTGFGVEITGPRNLLNEISTEVREGKLYIENRNSCNFVRSYKRHITVRIFAPEFPDIQNYGTGDIKSIGKIEGHLFSISNRNAAGTIELDLSSDSVIIATHTGVCDVVVKGEANTAEIFDQGVGFIDARDLHAAYTFANNSSINSVWVNSAEYLFATIHFSGNIYYGGTPNHIDQDIIGDGRLIPLD